MNGEEYPPIHAEQFDFPDDEIETAVEIFMAVLKGADIPVGEGKKPVVSKLQAFLHIKHRVSACTGSEYHIQRCAFH